MPQSRLRRILDMHHQSRLRDNLVPEESQQRAAMSSIMMRQLLGASFLAFVSYGCWKRRSEVLFVRTWAPYYRTTVTTTHNVLVVVNIYHRDLIAPDVLSCCHGRACTACNCSVCFIALRRPAPQPSTYPYIPISIHGYPAQLLVCLFFSDSPKSLK
jgi:hypothetical protein